MMSQPFFSICIPTYNRAHLLPAALDSALAQTDPDFEIVVVDNASTDSTQDVLKRYDDPRIRVVRNAETVSMYANHNICLEYAKAPWVVFLHSDDRLTPSALARYRDEIGRYPSVAAITATCDYYRPLWDSLGAESRYTLAGNDGIGLLFRHLGLNMPGACFSAAVVHELGGFDESSVVADHDFYIRLVLAGKRIAALRHGVIAIGATERTTNKLIRNKSWIFEQGRVLAKHVSNPAVFAALASSIQSWQPSELSRLLMYVAAGDNREALTQFENLGYPVVLQAKREKTYSHVRLYKLFGHAGHRLSMKLLASAQRWLELSSAATGR